MSATLLDRTTPIVDDATRRQFLVGLAAAGLLAGCGSAEPPAPAAPSSGSSPVRIDHRYGSTEVPPDPKRVVSVGIREADPLLALGVVPIAVTDFYTVGGAFELPWPWAREQQGDATIEVLPETPINVERIAALEPDLILGTSSGMEQADYDLLSAIAPTVAQSGEFPSFATPMEVELRTIAQALGRGDPAPARVPPRARHRGDGADQRVPLDQRGAPRPDRPRPVCPVLLRGGDAGRLPGVPAARRCAGRPRRDRREVPAEPGDIAAVDPQPALRPRPARPGARRRPRRQADHGALGDALSLFPSLLSLPPMLDGLVPMLTAAVDGDPATRAPS